MFAVKVSGTRSCSRRTRATAPVWLPVVFAILGLVVPARFAQAEGTTSLTPAEQEKINRAIKRGVQALNALQGPQGTWAPAGEYHALGYAALPGLTLLECDVAASDPPVQRAARAVRLLAPASTDTYDIALSILFLDRLGEAQDKELIRTLAIRLVVGQTITGGWGYKCALVPKKDQDDLLKTLAKLDPQQAADQGTTPGQDTQPGSQDKDKPKDEGANQDNKPRPVVMAMIPPRLRGLSIFGQGVPRLVDQPGRDHQFVAPTTDNSNTQFAMLGLWAARKHGVPIKRSLDLILRRFKTSQNEDGGWGYRYREGGGEGAAGFGGAAPTMTCAGLLGMAMGNGLAGKPVDKAKVDPAVRKGFVALSKHVGEPTGKAGVRQSNLYLVWSIERVAVLFNLHTIGGKDWYRWAAEMLVANQQEEGHWHNGGYWGTRPAIDTCFALLVLKRANLAADLGSQLPFEARALEREVNNEVNRVVDGKSASLPVDAPKPTPAAPADSPFEKIPGQEQPAATPAGTPAAEGTTVPPQPNKNRTVLVVLLVMCGVILVGSIIGLLVYLACRSGPAPADDEDDYRPRRRTDYAR